MQNAGECGIMELEEAMHICATQPINTEEWAEAKRVLEHYSRRRDIEEAVERVLSDDG